MFSEHNGHYLCVRYILYGLLFTCDSSRAKCRGARRTCLWPHGPNPLILFLDKQVFEPDVVSDDDSQ
jgi:hypothetical protein